MLISIWNVQKNIAELKSSVLSSRELETKQCNLINIWA